MFKSGDRVVTKENFGVVGLKGTVGPKGLYENTLNFGPDYWLDIIWDEDSKIRYNGRYPFNLKDCGYYPYFFNRISSGVVYKLLTLEVGKSPG